MATITSYSKTQLDALIFPKWTATTVYASGAYVLNPSGQIVSAKTGFTSGASYSASDWNIISTGGSAALPAPVRVTTASAQSLSAGGNTTLMFELETFDTANWHSTTTATNKLTCPAGAAGNYQVIASADVGATSNGVVRTIAIRKNNTKTVESVSLSPGTSHHALQVIDVVALAVGDYIDCAVYSTDAATISLVQFAPTLSAIYVGA